MRERHRERESVSEIYKEIERDGQAERYIKRERERVSEIYKEI